MIYVSVITAFLTGGFFSFVQFLIKRHDDEKDHTDEKEHLVEEALLAILHDKIYTVGTDIIRQGEISTSDMSNLEHLYEPYKALGGNGTCKKIMEKIDDLPIKTEDEKC